MRSRLRVAVPAALLDGLPGGHGRVWREALRGLERDGVRVVRRGRADVWLADGHADVGGLGSPLVVQVHEAPWDDPLLDPDFAATMAARTQAAVGRAARVITASEHARREIAAAHGPAEIDVVPHGVDLASYRPGAGGGPRVEPPYVLYVGTVHPRKNLPALRAAMATLPARLALVLSPAPDRRDSRELMRAAQAQLPGGVEAFSGLPDGAVAALMAGAAAVCVPSLSEGFGLPALEAMACGAPVVAANRGPLPEVVGRAGLLVEPDPAGLRAGLERALADRGDLRAAGRERARAFTWEATAAGWRRALERAVG